jgi:transcriptional regulator with XRE-family HTH domain
MPNLRDILAHNLREYRRTCGISQAKLAEKAQISTQYVAMIELCRQFPTPEVLDRIATALDIEAYRLFAVPPSPEESMKQLHDTLVSNVERIISEAVKKAVAEHCQDKPPAR